MPLPATPPPLPRGGAVPPPVPKSGSSSPVISSPTRCLSPPALPRPDSTSPGAVTPIRCLSPPPVPSSTSTSTSPLPSHPASPAPSRSRFGTLKVSAATLYHESDHSLLTQFGDLKETTSNRAAARKIARNKETIATLLEAIRSKPNFTKMVEYSLECLRNLAVDTGSVEEMIEEDVVEVS